MIEQIFKAIDANDLPMIRDLLISGSDPNQVNVDFLEQRPLHAAVIAVGKGANPNMFDLLINYGSDINLTSPGIGGGTPLQVAVYNNYYEVANSLLRLGADPNIQGEEGDGPLRASVAMENYDMARLLLEHGATRTIDCFGGLEGATALGMAVSRLNFDLVALLLKAHARKDVIDLDYETAIDKLPSVSKSNALVREKIRVLLFD